MSVVTRFAPSPTGMLHLGGARTALFNWLYARHHGGTFRLRLEDTDRKRSTPEAIAAIVDGLTWLGLDWDGEIVRQSERRQRHVEVAHALLAAGGAYRCYCTPEELEAMRAEARAQGRAALYDGRWRDRDAAEAPPGVDPVIRFRAPREGETIISDLVQRNIKIDNTALDDMVLLRADGTPTYMHSVVVDDHDMGITHAIRGDDHLTNAFRQTQLFRALGWEPPAYAHIPLIHGPDGAKLSKRHGAVAVGAYAELGILPAAMRNALLRLGWSHGDDEIIDDGPGRRLVRPGRGEPGRGALRHGEAAEPQRPLHPGERRFGAAGRRRAPARRDVPAGRDRRRAAGASRPCCPRPRRARRPWSSLPTAWRSCFATRKTP